MVYVGVDLHKTQFTVCILHGEEVLQEVYRTDRSGYQAFLDDLKDLEVRKNRIELAVETVGNVYFFMKSVEAYVCKVKVVNTMKFKVIVQSTSKTDNRDAQTIAFYLSKDMLPTVTLPDEVSRKLAKYVKVRDRFVKIMTRLKNQIHGIFMEEGQNLTAAHLSSRKKLMALLEMEMDEDIKFLIKEIVMELISMKDRVKEIEKKMEILTAEDDTVKLLRTIPGTGLVSASAVRSIVADIKRFDHPKKLAAYAGLVPWVSNSNETIRHGHITKRGSTILRNAFVQMAMGIIRQRAKSDIRTTALSLWYERLFKKVGGGKSKIALARKLSTVVWSMLYNNKAFAYSI